MPEKSGVAPQAVSLPNGGGAVQGVGETFQADPFKGTATFSIALPTSPARSGFGPQLALQYSASNGNGPFGIGWQLDLPRISRRTERGLPRYTDGDVFVLSGAEELVPALTVSQGSWSVDHASYGPFDVVRYRPRTEGLFARIERWVRRGSADDEHWRVTTSANLTSVFGRTSAARIVDPADPRRIFSWLIEETLDTRGNHLLYEYVLDDGTDAPRVISEQARAYAQRYLHRVLYGNSERATSPSRTGVDHSGPLQNRDRAYHFELIFDYGRPAGTPAPVDPYPGPDRLTSAHGWAIRPDPFSSYRPGFELRTTRRCERISMFHHFARELGKPLLVRSLDLDYEVDPDSQLSLLVSATQRGWEREVTGYSSTALPPASFIYSRFDPESRRYQSVTARNGALPDRSLADPNLTLVDLDGDGLPDVLETGPAGFRWWRNLGEGRLDRPRPMVDAPAGVMLGQDGVGFGDLDGNGRAELQLHRGALRGFWETTKTAEWGPFRAYGRFPEAALDGAATRALDLTGDGLPDLLTTGDDLFLWYRCLGADGYAEPSAVPRLREAERFPDINFDDPQGRVRLADLSGDGLLDIVLLHDGRIDYWPNLGYGRFGRRVSMADAPRLGADFDPRRLLLADINGDGCADLLYVESGHVRLWLNRSGNGWSAERTIRGTPPVTDLDALEVIDFFGTGTAALVWSYGAERQPDGPLKALDFCGGQKAYLLVESRNGLGATTRVSYGASTRHSRQAELAGQPWATRLPFPVLVVDRVEQRDEIAGTSLVTTYRYHHGYWDGREREFRGFGRVDQEDAERFDAIGGADETGLAAAGAAFRAPPTLRRTWFHTGAYHEERALLERFADEYWAGDPRAFPAPTHELSSGESPADAHRALRGSPLRTELYALDGSPAEPLPYTVSETSYRVLAIQPALDGQEAVYLTRPLESLNYQYEREPADPRISQTRNLTFDDFGNVTASVAVSYPRRVPVIPEQGQLSATLAGVDYLNLSEPRTDQPGFHLVGLAYQNRGWELTGLDWPWPTASAAPASPLGPPDFAPFLDPSLPEQPFDWARPASFSGPARRLLSWSRTYFRIAREPDVLDSPGSTGHRLPLGQVDALALPYERLQAALTSSLLQSSYGGLPDATLQAAGYSRESDVRDVWWVPSGRQAFRDDLFYLPHRMQDAFGSSSELEHDPYGLLVRRTRDPLGNETLAEHDYRVLQPHRVRDPNQNWSEAAFDRLGLVAAMAIRGKSGQATGDSLAGLRVNLDRADIERYDADPLTVGPELLGGATIRWIYDVGRFGRLGQPPVVAALRRDTHQADLSPGQLPRLLQSLTYCDGFARVLQSRVRAEPGLAPRRDPVSGRLVVTSGQLDQAFSAERWIVSGGTLYDNKGRAVRQFEPCFSATHTFEADRELIRFGAASTVLYDPLDRAVLSLRADHAWEKLVVGPWEQQAWDACDTGVVTGQPPDGQDPTVDPHVGTLLARLDPADYLPTWYAARVGLPAGDPERLAAIATADHAGTPLITRTDALGRTVQTLADNGPDGSFETRARLDVQGNLLAVTDPRGVETFRNARYDLVGRLLVADGPDAGPRRVLPDASGTAVLTWDARGVLLERILDPLRRPAELWVTEPGGRRELAELVIYGEALAMPEDTNHRGRVLLAYDGSGELEAELYDFKGNLRRVARRLPLDDEPPRWTALLAEPTLARRRAAARLLLDADRFVTASTFDALDRVVEQLAPDGAVLRSRFNEASLLEQVELQLSGQAPRVFLAGAEYNARGQRQIAELGNGVRCQYTYDRDTFRLAAAQTARADGSLLLDLAYTYDPVGNVTRSHDRTVETTYFQNQQVDGRSDYGYDALYRLRSATGREHPAMGPGHERLSDRKQTEFAPLQPLANAQALRAYRQTYAYDPAGNLSQIQHTAPNGGWTRDLGYEAASNRLKRAEAVLTEPGFDFVHDANGNLASLAHLPALTWDHAGRLLEVDCGAGTTARYRYDTAGQRVRKIYLQGNVREERVYVGGYERFRRWQGGRLRLERVTHHVGDGIGRLALVELRTDDPANPEQRIRYQLADGLGSGLLEVDETPAARLISLECYYPFGCTAYQAGRDQVDVQPKRYRYSGKERDDETGLYYYGTRYYAPWLGRWLSCDPAASRGNPYAFVLNNPLLLVDPDGRAPTIAELLSPREGFTIVPGGHQQPGFTKLQRNPNETGRFIVETHYLPTNPGEVQGSAYFAEAYDIQTGTFLGTGGLPEIETHGALEKIHLPSNQRAETHAQFQDLYGPIESFDLGITNPETVNALKGYVAGGSKTVSKGEFLAKGVARGIEESFRAIGREIGPFVELVPERFGGQLIGISAKAKVQPIAGAGGTAASLAMGPGLIVLILGKMVLTDEPGREAVTRREPLFTPNASAQQEADADLAARVAGFGSYDEMLASLATAKGCSDCSPSQLTVGAAKLILIGVEATDLQMKVIAFGLSPGLDVPYFDLEQFLQSVVYDRAGAEKYLNQVSPASSYPSISATR